MLLRWFQGCPHIGGMDPRQRLGHRGFQDPAKGGRREVPRRHRGDVPEVMEPLRRGG